jgi:salicylate hydroxylase
MPKRTIIVAGAGIGGLTASLALAAQGFGVIVIEKAEQLETIGAGLQLSPNASHILIGLGLRHHLAPHVFVPEGISVMSARTGKEIGRIPLGEPVETRYGAPYWIAHRADLQSALLARVLQNPAIELRLGTEFKSVTSGTSDVRVVQRRGAEQCEETALALIGADGVRSGVRQEIFPESVASFTGRVAWRGIIDAAQFLPTFDRNRTQLWLGANAHLVVYPMSGGRQLNVVAISRGAGDAASWNDIANASDIRQEFKLDQWPTAARAIVDAVDGWRRWSLFSVDANGPWVRDRTALLGDAAHAMLPFIAQGAAMAIEDAAVLAGSLRRIPDDIPAALRHYADARQPRVKRVQLAARQTGHIYHLSGAMALARDLAMSVLGGERLLSRQDWIYNWRSIDSDTTHT